ncbi:MAG: hypothetical protein NZ789_22315, partial [Pseudomonadales bacterium]|nr:hypothetical protein [Pseudomonadales bacterium]
TDGVTYTVLSRGTDNAGNVQLEYGSDTFTYDVTSPNAGQVQDGLEDTDQDWSNSTTTISGSWSGFFDATSGIAVYEYAIGSNPGSVDIWPWDSLGTDTLFTQGDLTLESGETYYISVRAIDHSGNTSSVAGSDGLTVDALDPAILSLYEGSTVEDMDYQQDGTELIIVWSGSDATRTREITGYQVCLGTNPADSNTVDWIGLGSANEYTFSGLNLTEGTTYYASARAQDLAGNISEIFTGDGITIDQSGPLPGQLNDGTEEDIDWVTINYLSDGNWTGFLDSLSGIAEYEYSLGLNPGQTQVVSWTSAGLDTSITVSASLTQGPTYFANVRSIDSVSNIG